jgi:hypothetical protein
MIVNVNIGPPIRTTCEGSDSVPLPCIRGLWQSENDKVWQQGYMSFLSQKKNSHPLNLGHLRNSKSGIPRSTGRNYDLGEWCMNLDSFGMLVMMIARLGLDSREQLIILGIS